MENLLGIFLGFVLTGLIGNRLLQSWQHHNWLRQQQFLGHEKEYMALKQLSEEISAIMGARLYKMKRLLSAVSLSDSEMEGAVDEYREVLANWNDRLNSFYVRLTLYADCNKRNQLEHDIQKSFYASGAKLEALVRRRRSGVKSLREEQQEILAGLNRIQRRIFSFNRDLLSHVEDFRMRIYFGETVWYTEQNLNLYSTLELVKSLFIREVNAHAVFRPLPYPRLPRRGR